jgi:hypothetical protein
MRLAEEGAVGHNSRGGRARWAVSSFVTGVFFPVSVRIGGGPRMARDSLPLAIAFVGIGSVLWFTRGR